MLFSPTASLRRLKTSNFIYRQLTVDRFCYYATEGVSLSRSDSNYLTKCCKIFSVNDINCLNDTQKYFGYLPIDIEINTRKVKFFITTKHV